MTNVDEVNRYLREHSVLLQLETAMMRNWWRKPAHYAGASWGYRRVRRVG